MQSGPAAPIAGLPVMSELLKRMADLDEEEAGLLRSMGTAAPQVWCLAHSQSLLTVRRKRKKNHYIFSSQLRADQMPGPHRPMRPALRCAGCPAGACLHHGTLMWRKGQASHARH